MKLFASLFMAFLPVMSVAVTADYNVIPLPNKVDVSSDSPFVLNSEVTIRATGDEWYAMPMSLPDISSRQPE